MSPMPDFPIDQEDYNDSACFATEEEDQNAANERKVSVTDAERSNLTVFENKETKSSDISDRQRIEKTSLIRDASVDTLASKTLTF